MYLFNEGKLNVDMEQWQDKSIMLLANNSGQSISISRDFIPWGMSFKEFSEREISSIAKQLTDYKEISRKDMRVSDLDCILTEFQWRSPKGEIHQMTLLVNYPNVVLMLTASCEGKMTEGQKSHLLEILSSFQKN